MMRAVRICSSIQQQMNSRTNFKRTPSIKTKSQTIHKWCTSVHAHITQHTHKQTNKQTNKHTADKQVDWHTKSKKTSYTKNQTRSLLSLPIIQSNLHICLIRFILSISWLFSISFFFISLFSFTFISPHPTVTSPSLTSSLIFTNIFSFHC